MRRRDLFKLAAGAALYIPASRLAFGVPHASPTLWAPARDIWTPDRQILPADQGDWISLHTGDPGPDGAAHEVAGNGYARVRLADDGTALFKHLPTTSIRYAVRHTSGAQILTPFSAIHLAAGDSMQFTWGPS